jgi:TetR/AcrR family transcriptional regulator, copper-responsive repressor
MGRPREFDRHNALQIAMRLFWQRGFEGVSVADLTAAMNIAAPSFYAAFGSKAALYREALECYQHRPGALRICPLQMQPPVREAVGRVLRMAIATVAELSPSAGCMIANGMLAVSPELAELAELPAGLRRGLVEALEMRMERAIEHGEIAAGSSAKTLARYFAAIVHGVAIQGRDGASREQLEQLVEFALGVLPIATTAQSGRASRTKRSAPRGDRNRTRRGSSSSRKTRVGH